MGANPPLPLHYSTTPSREWTAKEAIHLAIRGKLNVLIFSVFHSVPGVPRVKMELWYYSACLSVLFKHFFQLLEKPICYRR